MRLSKDFLSLPVTQGRTTVDNTGIPNTQLRIEVEAACVDIAFEQDLVFGLGARAVKPRETHTRDETSRGAKRGSSFLVSSRNLLSIVWTIIGSTLLGY